jgi:outer membrane protein assembly factor BamB
MNRPSRHASLPLALAAAASLAIIAGCASSGQNAIAKPPIASDARANAFPIAAADWSRLGYKWDWTGFPFVSGNGRITDIVVFPDVVVTQESGSVVSVLEASNGSQRWSSGQANPLTRFVGNVRFADAARGDVLVSASESELFILSLQTGTLLDRQKLDKVVNTRPLASGDRVIFGTAVGEVFSHWLERSFKVWGFGTSAAIDTDLARIDDATIVAANQAGQLTFLNDAGSLVSQSRIFGGPGAPMATGNGMVFIASVDQSLYAYDTAGRQVWRLRTNAPLREKPTFANGVVYCSLQEPGLSAFDAASGRTLWSNKDVHGVVVATRKGRLIVRDGERVLAVDPQRGDIIEAVTAKGLQRLATDAFEDGNLYAVSTSGVVAKFLPR